MYARIKEHPNLVRDMRTQHIVQTDSSLVRKHDAREKAMKAARVRDAELDAMRKDVADIKEMLKRLLSPSSGSAGWSPLSWPPVLGYDPRETCTANAIPQFWSGVHGNLNG